jgi:rhodanese-related sulfurtransferase
MDQIIEFVGNHLGLVVALVVILTLLVQNLIGGGGGKDAVDPARATDLINHEDAVVVDVRPMADFNQGHIIGAINIPSNGFANQLKQLERHKAKPIIVSCRSGAQSAQACATLRKAGFEKVHNLRGGILAWQSANLPVTRK